MKKSLAIILTAGLLASCGTAKYEDRTTSWRLPPELADCKMYTLENDGIGYMKVLVCPSRDVSIATPQGKEQVESAVVFNRPYGGEPIGCFVSNMTHREYHHECMSPDRGSDVCTRQEELFHQSLHNKLDDDTPGVSYNREGIIGDSNVGNLNTRDRVNDHSVRSREDGNY